MKHFATTAFLIMSGTVNLGHANEPLRIWKDDSGNFEAKATFVLVVDGKAKLELADGRNVAVPVDRLSGSDRRYIARTFRKSSPARSTQPRGKLRSFDNTEQRYGIRWHRTLDAAGNEAKLGSQFESEKPVMCFRVLGDLDGFM